MVGAQNSFQTTLVGMVGIMDKSLATAGTQADITVTQSLSNAWASYMFALRSTHRLPVLAAWTKQQLLLGHNQMSPLPNCPHIPVGVIHVFDFACTESLLGLLERGN